MSMGTIRRLLEMLTGYKFIRQQYFPAGANLFLDINNRFSQSEIKVIFDIGANSGQSLGKFKSAYPGAMIYSFEPVKATFEKLKQAAANHPNVVCEQFAMGSKTGSATIFLEVNSEWNSLIEINEKSDKPTEIIEVQTVDEYVKLHEISRIDILKSDTEGFDLEVMKGAVESLKQKRVSFIYVETAINGHDMRHTHLNKLAEFLEPLGYYFYHLYEAKGFGPSYYSNALFVRHDLLPKHR